MYNDTPEEPNPTLLYIFFAGGTVWHMLVQIGGS